MANEISAKSVQEIESGDVITETDVQNHVRRDPSSFTSLDSFLEEEGII